MSMHLFSKKLGVQRTFSSCLPWKLTMNLPSHLFPAARRSIASYWGLWRPGYEATRSADPQDQKGVAQPEFEELGCCLAHSEGRESEEYLCITSWHVMMTHFWLLNWGITWCSRTSASIKFLSVTLDAVSLHICDQFKACPVMLETPSFGCLTVDIVTTFIDQLMSFITASPHRLRYTSNKTKYQSLMASFHVYNQQQLGDTFLWLTTGWWVASPLHLIGWN